MNVTPHDSNRLSSSNTTDNNNPVDNNSNNKKGSDDRNCLLLAAFIMCGVSITTSLIMFYIMRVECYRHINDKNNENQPQEEQQHGLDNSDDKQRVETNPNVMFPLQNDQSPSVFFLTTLATLLLVTVIVNIHLCHLMSCLKIVIVRNLEVQTTRIVVIVLCFFNERKKRIRRRQR